MISKQIICLMVFGLLLFFQNPISAELKWNSDGGWQYAGDRSNSLPIDAGDFEIVQDLMNSARAAQESGKLKKAIKLYSKVKRDFPRSLFTAEALFQTAKIEYESHSYRRAFNALTDIILSYPDYNKYNQVVRFQFSIATDLYDGRPVRYLSSNSQSKNSYDRAVIMYEKVVSNAPFSEYAPLALMKAAELHIHLNNKIAALDALDRLINNYPYSDLLSDAYLLLAQTFAGLVLGPEYDQGATRQAISHFEDFLVLFPDHPKVKDGEKGLVKMQSVEAQSKIVRGDFYYYRWRDLRAAKVFYNEAITIAPTSPQAGMARKMISKIDAKLFEFSPNQSIAADSQIPAPNKQLAKYPADY